LSSSKNSKFELNGFFDEPDAGFLARFKTLMSSCSILRNLNLFFNIENRMTFDMLSPESPWTELRSLVICGISLSEGDVVSFATSHQPQLTYISLSFPKLEAGK
jgi:hypothetical protein